LRVGSSSKGLIAKRLIERRVCSRYNNDATNHLSRGKLSSQSIFSSCITRVPFASRALFFLIPFSRSKIETQQPAYEPCSSLFCRSTATYLQLSPRLAHSRRRFACPWHVGGHLQPPSSSSHTVGELNPAIVYYLP
jgi:hypothetical protein